MLKARGKVTRTMPCPIFSFLGLCTVRPVRLSRLDSEQGRQSRAGAD